VAPREKPSETRHASLLFDCHPLCTTLTFRASSSGIFKWCESSGIEDGRRVSISRFRDGVSDGSDIPAQRSGELRYMSAFRSALRHCFAAIGNRLNRDKATSSSIEIDFRAAARGGGAPFIAIGFIREGG